MDETTNDIYLMYIGYFGRPPAPGGLDYYVDLAISRGGDLAAIVDDFWNSSESQALFSGKTPAEQVDIIFNNLFGASPTGTYWEDELAAGRISLPELAYNVAKGAIGDGAIALANKVDTAELWVADLRARTDGENPFTDAAGVTAGRAALAAVTSDTATVPAADAVSTTLDGLVGPTFTLTASADNTDLEGSPLTYTLTASSPVSEDTTVSFRVVAGDNAAANSGTNSTNLNDFQASTFNPLEATIAAGEDSVDFTVQAPAGDGTELPEDFSVVATVDGVEYTVEVTLLDAPGAQSLTTAIDDLSGTDGPDLFTGIVGAGATLQALDTIDGGLGTDTLRVLSDGAGLPAGLNLTSIENLVVRSSAAAVVDSTTLSSVNSVSTTQSVAATVTASAAQDVSVSGATGAIDVAGGNSVTVSDAAADLAIKVGESGAGTTNAAGVISVTDSKQGTGTIEVDGGTDVTVEATTDATAAIADVGNIVVGANTAASGDVTIVQNVNHNGEGDDVAQADITVTGGSSVDVTVNAASTAKDEGSNKHIVNGAVTVTGDDATTTVSVVQNNTATTFTKAAVPTVKETSVVTFQAMEANETLIVNGLTFTAETALTAEEVAEAFADLTQADRQSSGGPTANGIYSGQFNTGIWTSGPADGATVTFTAADNNEPDLVFTGTATTNDGGARAPTQIKSAGTLGAVAVTSGNSVTTGAVRVDEGGDASITEVTLDDYLSADLGKTGADLDALKVLTLKDSAGAAELATSATSLTLNIDNVDDIVTIDETAATVETLVLNATGGASTTAVTAAAVKDLTVTGSSTANVTGSTFTALETVTVSGSASFLLGGTSEADTLKSVDSTGTTGNVTIGIDGTQATYAGGSGVDTVTLATGTALTKSVDTGAGNDTVVFDAAVTGSTATLSGGDGTDTLSMAVANAETLDASKQSFYTGFEVLLLNDAAGDNDDTADTVAIDLENLGFTASVISSGTVLDTTTATKSDTLELNNFASGGTLTITASPAGANSKHTVGVKEAATGSADTFNVKLSDNADTNFGAVTVADVETVALESDDTASIVAGSADLNTNTVELVLDKATAVTVTGDAATVLDITGDAVLVAVDASGATQALTYTADGTLAQTVTGGSGADQLTASGDSDIINGGGGADTLIAADGAGLAQLTGGAGNDTFRIDGNASAVNKPVDIKDFSAGDTLIVRGGNAGDDAISFQATAITLDPAGNPDLADFADEAIAQLGTGALGWFEFNGNTYIVMDDDNDDGAVFDASEDTIVKLTGVYDLSTASYNSTSNTLELG